MSANDLPLFKRQELEILKEFQRLCAENSFTYFITAGTLLGAVRHKGFIPWDDDIDIAMPRDDFERLAAVCATSLSNGFFYQTTESDPNSPFLFSKLRMNGTEVDEPNLRRVDMHKGVYIDIFPLDACPKNNLAGKFYFKWVEQLRCAVMARVNLDFVCMYKKRYMRLLHTILKRFSRDTLVSLYDTSRKIVDAFCSGEKLCTLCGAHGYPCETYDKRWFSETVTMTFEGIPVPAPAGWDELLTNMYGDYMTPPPENERQGHFE